MKERLFLDSDVIIDIAINRKPFAEPAAVVLSEVEAGTYSGFTSAAIFTNVYYIHRKFSDHTIALRFLRKLRLILKVLDVSDLIIQKALDSNFNDFEDGIQYFTAVHNKIDFILTRNVDDFKNSLISVHTPLEFINLKRISG
jgi:predicted nucleic acid-binding protein